MRIIAKNHDYYDSVMAYGQDRTVVFDRKEAEYRRGEIPSDYKWLEPSLSPRAAYRHPYGHGNQIGFDRNKKRVEFCYYPFMVAFCGKLYPGIEVASRKPGQYDWSKSHYYDFDTYADFLAQNEFEWKDQPRSDWLGRRGSVRVERDVGEFFAKHGEDHVGWFAEQRKPIAVYFEEDGHEPVLYFNCELKRYHFGKVFDAYTAFQELDMFVGGVMTHPASQPTKTRPKRPNPVDISDEDLRDKKGFDDMSFKKPKSKKR